MALHNGATYYGLTDDELKALNRDGDYNYSDFTSLFTIEVDIGGTKYWFSSSMTDAQADALLDAMDDDFTRPNVEGAFVTLDSAVYYSGFGFRLIGV